MFDLNILASSEILQLIFSDDSAFLAVVLYFNWFLGRIEKKIDKHEGRINNLEEKEKISKFFN